MQAFIGVLWGMWRDQKAFDFVSGFINWQIPVWTALLRGDRSVRVWGLVEGKTLETGFQVPSRVLAGCSFLGFFLLPLPEFLPAALFASWPRWCKWPSLPCVSRHALLQFRSRKQWSPEPETEISENQSPNKYFLFPNCFRYLFQH